MSKYKNRIDTTNKKIMESDEDIKNEDNKFKKRTFVEFIESKKNYVKKDILASDKLSKKEIYEILRDYEQVTDIRTVKFGSDIKYFIRDNNKLHFRYGGRLKKISYPDYIVLESNAYTWSVQLKNCDLFKRIELDDIRVEYTKEIENKDVKIEELVIYIKELKKYIRELEHKLDKYKKK